MGACYVCRSGEEGPPCGECAKCFCSAQHRQLHINSEDGMCLPYAIKESSDCGRYLVAEKDITPGDLILSEDCLVWGPNHVGDHLCIECLAATDVQNICGHCGYLLCEEHSIQHPNHQIECSLFQQSTYKLIQSVRENDIESAYPIIAPLRCIRMRSKNPVGWRIISNLMDHREEREKEHAVYIEPYKHDVVDKIVEDLKAASVDEVVEVLGYLDVNSIAVRGKDGVYRGRGIYPVASLMNHSCICNTRNIIDGIRLETRATVPIKTGESITTHYVSPLLPINIRREKLRERWFFDCTCERCCSSTDLSAYTSGLKCNECTGYLLPADPTNYATVYRCESCGSERSTEHVEKLISSLTPLVQALQVFQMPDTEEEENLVSMLSQTLHPHHQLVLELKLNLARKLGRSSGKLDIVDTPVLLKKIILCLDSLDVMNIIYPGLSKYRGLLCYELADSLLILSARIVDNHADPVERIEEDVLRVLCVATRPEDREVEEFRMEQRKEAFVQQIRLCELIVKEGIRCLELDRPGSYENDICTNLYSIKTACGDFITFREYV